MEWNTDLNAYVLVHVQKDNGSSKGKGKGKGKSSTKGKGKGKTQKGPFSDPNTDWYPCQTIASNGVCRGWVFKGEKTPGSCKFCHKGFCYDKPYSRDGIPKAGEIISPPQVIKPAARRDADSPSTVAVDDSAKAKALFDQLTTQGCDEQVVTKVLEANGLKLPKQKVTIEKTAVLLDKANNEVKHIENLLGQQTTKHGNLSKNLEKCEEQLQHLAEQMLLAKAKVEELKLAQFEEFKADGILTIGSDTVQDFKQKAKIQSDIFNGMINAPPADASQLKGYLETLRNLFSELANASSSLHPILPSNEGEKEFDLGSDEENLPHLNSGQSTPLAPTGPQFPDSWGAEDVNMGSKAANANTPEPVVNNVPGTSSESAELQYQAWQLWQNMPDLKASLERKSRFKIKGRRDPATPRSRSRSGGDESEAKIPKIDS